MFRWHNDVSWYINRPRSADICLTGYDWRQISSTKETTYNGTVAVVLLTESSLTLLQDSKYLAELYIAADVLQLLYPSISLGFFVYLQYITTGSSEHVCHHIWWYYVVSVQNRCLALLLHLLAPFMLWYCLAPLQNAPHDHPEGIWRSYAKFVERCCCFVLCISAVPVVNLWMWFLHCLLSRRWS